LAVGQEDEEIEMDGQLFEVDVAVDGDGLVEVAFACHRLMEDAFAYHRSLVRRVQSRLGYFAFCFAIVPY
jgi:hypothetical protein